MLRLLRGSVSVVLCVLTASATASATASLAVAADIGTKPVMSASLASSRQAGAVPWPTGEGCLPSLGADLGSDAVVVDGLCLDGWAYVDWCPGCGGDSQVIAHFVGDHWEVAFMFPNPACRAAAVATGMPLIVVDRVVWPCDGGLPPPDPAADEFPLRIGSSGPRVSQAQQRLVEFGFDIGASGVDGHFGPDTNAAVVEWQQSVGLSNTGRLYAPAFNQLTGATTPLPAAASADTAPAEIRPPVAMLPTDAGGAVDPAVGCPVETLAQLGMERTTVVDDWSVDWIVLQFSYAHCSPNWAAVRMLGFGDPDLSPDGMIPDVARLYVFDLVGGRVVASIDAPYGVSRSIAYCLGIDTEGAELVASMLYDTGARECDDAAFAALSSAGEIRIGEAAAPPTIESPVTSGPPAFA